MNKVFIISLIAMLLVGCQQVNKQKDQQKINDSINLENRLEVAERIIEVYHRFPTPEEMLSIISIDNINYNPNLLNTTKGIHQYLDSRAQALNLGVYAADLAYLTIYEKYNESVKYFEAMYELSDKLRISSAFEHSLLKRIQVNMNNSDSLRVLSEEAFTSLSSYLESNNNEKIFALISMGGFVEALYLSINLVGNYQVNNSVIQKIIDQKYVLENIIKYALPYSNDRAISASIAELEGIREIYSELSMEVTETKVSRDSTGKLIINGGEKLIMTKEQYQNLRKITFSLRNDITQN